MSKQAYYFSHDSNAHLDEKILAMRSVYKSEGYGWFWIIIEMLRDANDYRLKCTGKYWQKTLASQLQTDVETVTQFVNDCINEFDLLKTDGESIWSASLLKRMDLKEKKSSLAKKLAKNRHAPKRAAKKVAKQAITTTPEMDATTDATLDATPIATTHAIKEIKGNEIKQNENKVNNNKETESASSAPLLLPLLPHVKFLNQLMHPQNQQQREAIEKQAHTKLTPPLLDRFINHLVTEDCKHEDFTQFKAHLRNWLITKPDPKLPVSLHPLPKKKIV